MATIGAQSAVCGGGRYDGLFQEIGGESTPGVGFALGMERVFSALAAQGSDIETENELDVDIIVAGTAVFRASEGIRAAVAELHEAQKSLPKTDSES